MKKKEEDFNKDAWFSYNLGRKRLVTFSMILIALLAAAFIITYILAWKNSDFILFKIINMGIGHITYRIKSLSLIGAFYSAFFGGLFFVIMSVEAAFVTFLTSGKNAFMLMAIFLSGIIMAYTANYFIGLKFAPIAKKLISPRQFYKIKGKINKYGPLAVFVFNVLPLPSQPLSTILGVFKYNKTKFYVYFIAGQSIKYLAITIIYIYIIN